MPSTGVASQNLRSKPTSPPWRWVIPFSFFASVSFWPLTVHSPFAMRLPTRPMSAPM